MLDQNINKFEYSHYLFAELCMDIMGRSLILITSGQLKGKANY